MIDGGGDSLKLNRLNLIKEYYPVFGLSTGKITYFLLFNHLPVAENPTRQVFQLSFPTLIAGSLISLLFSDSVKVELLTRLINYLFKVVQRRFSFPKQPALLRAQRPQVTE